MFTVDEPTAEAIRLALDKGGELSAVVELRRHFPLITDNEHARSCVRAIASWKPPAREAAGGAPRAPWMTIDPAALDELDERGR